MRKLLAAQNATVAVFDSHVQTQGAVERLQESGYDVGKLSVVGKENSTAARVTGCYCDGTRVRYWGEFSACWSTFWEQLSGWALLAIPGLGQVMIAGPLGGWIIRAVENAGMFGGLSALGAGLYTLGMPRSAVTECEAAVKAGRFLVVAHGAAGEIARATQLLTPAKSSAAGKPVPNI